MPTPPEPPSEAVRDHAGRQARAARPAARGASRPPGGRARRGRRRPSRDARCWPGTPYAARAPSRRTSRWAREPGTGPLLDALHAAGVRVLLPVRAARPRPRLGGVHRAGARWPPRASGCSSRSGARLGVDAVRDADVVLVPGLAVSPAGDRLGPRRRLLRPGAGPRGRPARRACCSTTTRSGSTCPSSRTTGRSPHAVTPAGVHALARRPPLTGPRRSVVVGCRHEGQRVLGRRLDGRRARRPTGGTRRRPTARSGRRSGEDAGWPETPVRLIQRDRSRSASETTIRIDGADVTS